MKSLLYEVSLMHTVNDYSNLDEVIRLADIYVMSDLISLETRDKIVEHLRAEAKKSTKT